MRTLLPIAVLLSLAACDGATPSPQGAAHFGLANNDQSATVSDQTRNFAAPVVGKVVRSPGGIAFRLVTPAYADTTILNGAPVAGAVVCMDEPAPGGPAPSQLCNNTGSDGTVAFFYRSGTKADTFVYHANATVNGVPVQPDSARFVQQPGPVAHSDLVNGAENIPSGTPYWFKEGRFEDAYHNAIPDTVSVTNATFTLAAGADFNMGSRVGILPGAGAVAGDTATLVFRGGGAELHRTLATLTAGSVAGTWGVSFAAGAP